MFKKLGLVLAAVILILIVGLVFWLWPGALVRVSAGVPVEIGSRQTIDKVLEAAGLDGFWLRRPLVIIRLDSGAIAKNEFTIWQRLNPDDSSPPALGCRWDKTRLGGRAWTMQAMIDPPLYSRLPAGERDLILNRGLGYCLQRMVNEAATDTDLIDTIRSRVDGLLDGNNSMMFRFKPPKNS